MYHIIVQIVLFSVAFYITNCWRNRYIIRQLWHLPGPLNLPLLGSSYVFLGKSYSQIFKAFHQITTKYGLNGSPVRFFLGTMPFVIINHPEHAQAILTSAACLGKSWIYRYTPLEGIFSLPVQKWRLHRRAIQPSFNWGILKGFIPIFQAKADVLVQKLRQQATQREAFDIYRYVAACTLDMVYATTLGIEMNIQQQENCEYLDVLEELFELVTNRVTNVFLHPEWIYRLTGYHRRESHARRIFQTPAQEVLRQKPILLNASGPDPNSMKPQIFIDQLYRIARKDPRFDRTAIEKELNTMIFGGNETTAVTISNTLLLLAMHPTVQRKLVAEIDEVFGDSLEHITIEQLQQLTYMEAVLKEAMRLWPITTILGRKTSAEVRLDQLSIPADVNLVVDVYSIHRNPQYWGANADQFVPERFLYDNHHPYAFLGFSAGPRNCIGTRYAWISMKIMLASLLHGLELATPLRLEDIGLKLAMTLKVVNRHMITVSKRVIVDATTN